MNPIYLSAPVTICYALGDGNDNAATKPEFWVNFGLMLLEERSMMLNLVNRDFDTAVAEAGEKVHTYRPNKFKIKRKGFTGAVEEQDAKLDKVEVTLDQHLYVSFMIKDKEFSLNSQDLFALHGVPAINTLSRAADRALTGQVHRFIKTPSDRVGLLNGMSPSNTRSSVIAAQEKMDLLNVPDEDRRLILSPRSRSHFLNTDLIVKSNESGDQLNAALRRAFLGDLFGFDTFKSNNVPSITDDNTDTATGTVTAAMTANEVTSLEAVDISGYVVTVGEWAVVAGNDQPQHITAETNAAGDTTAVTLNEAQKNASSAGAEIKVYKKCDAKGAYGVDYDREITVDGHAANKGPQVGQLFSTGTGASRRDYTIIEVEAVTTTETKITLDRPLEVAIADNDALFPGPAGVYNLAFHKDALTIVTRPLALPPEGSGARVAVASSDGLGIRVAMQYDSSQMATRVNFDLLMGLAELDNDMATLVLG